MRVCVCQDGGEISEEAMDSLLQDLKKDQPEVGDDDEGGDASAGDDEEAGAKPNAFMASLQVHRQKKAEGKVQRGRRRLCAPRLGRRRGERGGAG